MKYAVILPDGAADEPVETLGGKTPLESARKPHMDWIASHGRQGRVVTVPARFSPGSDVATLSLFGYDPATDHPGRAPLEAAGRGITIHPGEWVFRCNFVTIVDGVMIDFTAGHISQRESDRLIADLNDALRGSNVRFHGGVSYRNLMTAVKNVVADLACTPPHDIPDLPIAEHLPKGRDAEWIRRIMADAGNLLANHDVNTVRRDLGENPATDIWLWGHGRPRDLQPFKDRFGLSGAVIAAVDLVRGIGAAIGLKVIDVPGATGYLDTDYAAKGAAAVTALDNFDFVAVHVEAPDEAGHLGDVRAKVTAIENVDRFVVGPIIERLRPTDHWRILVAPDHPTPVSRRVHTSTPPPFCLAGLHVRPTMEEPFGETAASESGLNVDPGFELMEYFLKAGL